MTTRAADRRASETAAGPPVIQGEGFAVAPLPRSILAATTEANVRPTRTQSP